MNSIESEKRDSLQSLESKRKLILTEPIGKSLVRLALPTMVVLIAQTAAGIIETYYVGLLGTSALVGVTLVFPVMMLMTMMSAGGIGGGVASSVSRALGAGRKDDAISLVMHSLLLAIVFGGMFTLAAFFWGTGLYRALGGSGQSLEAAVIYSNCIFAGAIPLWIVNLLSSALRGAGNVKVPAVITLTGALLLIPCSPLLIFGVGSFKGFGIAGAGLAMTLYQCVASLILVIYVMKISDLRLQIVALKAKFFWDILSVGLVSSVNALQSNLTTMLLTSVVGLFGTAAIAGYGMASRLDYVLVPLLFGLGSALLTVVGTAIGAGDVQRARKTTWMAAAVGGLFTEFIGLLAAIAPGAWMGLFSHDSAVLTTGYAYLRTVGPIYGAFGATFMLSFASLGGGRPIWPLLAGTVRFLIAAGLGWLFVGKLGSSQESLFMFIAAGSCAACLICTAAVLLNLTWKIPEKKQHQ